jgi:hypothetical protein
MLTTLKREHCGRNSAGSEDEHPSQRPRALVQPDAHADRTQCHEARGSSRG